MICDIVAYGEEHGSPDNPGIDMGTSRNYSEEARRHRRLRACEDDR